MKGQRTGVAIRLNRSTNLASYHFVLSRFVKPNKPFSISNWLTIDLNSVSKRSRVRSSAQLLASGPLAVTFGRQSKVSGFSLDLVVCKPALVDC